MTSGRPSSPVASLGSRIQAGKSAEARVPEHPPKVPSVQGRQVPVSAGGAGRHLLTTIRGTDPLPCTAPYPAAGPAHGDTSGPNRTIILPRGSCPVSSPLPPPVLPVVRQEAQDPAQHDPTAAL